MYISNFIKMIYKQQDVIICFKKFCWIMMLTVTHVDNLARAG